MASVIIQHGGWNLFFVEAILLAGPAGYVDNGRYRACAGDVRTTVVRVEWQSLPGVRIATATAV